MPAILDTWTRRLGQLYEELRPLAGLAAEADRATMLFYTALDNSETQAVAGPVAGVRSPEERLENAGLLARPDADALGSDLRHRIPGARAQAEHDRPIRILQRIG